jgi:hypothetical protein
MNTSSTIEPHQPNNQPQPDLSMTYLDENRQIDLILSVFYNAIGQIGFVATIASMSPFSPIEPHRHNK